MPTELTPEGVQRLMDQLDLDLGKVEASTRASADLKKEIRTRIATLKGLLAEAKKDLSSWPRPLAPEFAALTPLLKRALNLTTTQMGACRYQGTCSVMTDTQCAQLPGAFTPGKDCAGNPI